MGCAARFMRCSTIVPCLHVQTTAFPRLACELTAFLVVLIAKHLPVPIAIRPLVEIHPSDKLRPLVQKSSPVDRGPCFLLHAYCLSCASKRTVRCPHLVNVRAAVCWRLRIFPKRNSGLASIVLMMALKSKRGDE